MWTVVPLGPFSTSADARSHVVGRLSIERDDDVTRTIPARYAEVLQWRDDDDLVIARPDGHSYAVVFAALVFLQQGIDLGSKKLECGSSTCSMPGMAPL